MPKLICNITLFSILIFTALGENQTQANPVKDEKIFFLASRRSSDVKITKKIDGGEKIDFESEKVIFCILPSLDSQAFLSALSKVGLKARSIKYFDYPNENDANWRLSLGAASYCDFIVGYESDLGDRMRLLATGKNSISRNISDLYSISNIAGFSEAYEDSYRSVTKNNVDIIQQFIKNKYQDDQGYGVLLIKNGESGGMCVTNNGDYNYYKSLQLRSINRVGKPSETYDTEKFNLAGGYNLSITNSSVVSDSFSFLHGDVVIASDLDEVYSRMLNGMPRSGPIKGKICFGYFGPANNVSMLVNALIGSIGISTYFRSRPSQLVVLFSSEFKSGGIGNGIFRITKVGHINAVNIFSSEFEVFSTYNLGK